MVSVDLDLNLFFLKYPEKGSQQGGQFLAIDGLISIDIDEVEEVVDIFENGDIPADELDE